MMELIGCACGCGEQISPIGSKGRPRRFIRGHMLRLSSIHHSFKKGETHLEWVQTGSSHYAWKGGRIKHSNGYMKIWKPDHPNADIHNGYVYEHRLVMEQYLGRYLSKKEVVHHINGIKTDNRIENLQYFASIGEHNKHHGRMHREFSV
jgi:hypothetical protein